MENLGVLAQQVIDVATVPDDEGAACLLCCALLMSRGADATGWDSGVAPPRFSERRKAPAATPPANNLGCPNAGNWIGSKVLWPRMPSLKKPR